MGQCPALEIDSTRICGNTSLIFSLQDAESFSEVQPLHLTHLF
jgi:hypothetical protein